MTTIFFATDVHGSTICWKKFINAGRFYKADVIVLGGDMTGKAIVPIIHQGNNTYRVVLLEQVFDLHGDDEVQEMVKRISSRGYYPYMTNPDEIEELSEKPEQVNRLFSQEVLRTAEDWITYADEKLAGTGIYCFVAPGNDDMFELDALLRTSKHIQLAEGEVVELDEHHEMISSGWSNPTPWRTFREEEEDQLITRYEAMIGKVKNIHNCIFNFHVPPFDSGLDAAPEMSADLQPKFAGNSLVPVGSKAVRIVIEKYQPLMGFFGHIHESKGTARLGRTLCINPGSTYEQGSLCGVLVKIGREKIKNHVMTAG